MVFDGTELGELQRGFNAMVNGLRERERVRDLFGRHVGREVAAAAERERPQLGGEDRHAAVVFVDIVGSTQLVDNQPAAHVVKLLNWFFAIVVNEVDRHHGLINKFAGDAALAIFGAPNRLDRPEDAALAAARAIADRLANEMPEVQAGIGVAAGQIVAGNVGAKQRFEYTVVGKPVNQAARLCELAKSHPARLLASSDTLHAASETEPRGNRAVSGGGPGGNGRVAARATADMAALAESVAAAAALAGTAGGCSATAVSAERAEPAAERAAPVATPRGCSAVVVPAAPAESVVATAGTAATAGGCSATAATAASAVTVTAVLAAATAATAGIPGGSWAQPGVAATVSPAAPVLQVAALGAPAATAGPAGVAAC